VRTVRTAPASTAPASAYANTNAPMSLAPQAIQNAPAPHQVATNAPEPIAPSAPSTTSTGYMVQVSSQRNEADAQASYRVLQGKFPTVLGSRSPTIKRADLGEKGVYYRAMVGPFGSTEEASQFCGSLKSAGGQCVVQRN
jgi:cell division protein FtsN